MNNLFKNQFTNTLNTKINTLKELFKLPHTLYTNAKYNKKNKENDSKKHIYIPKIINTNYFKKNNNKRKQKNSVIKNNLLKELPKDLTKEIHHHHHKEPIPKRIRELVWTTNNGETFSHKCYVSWCDNTINVFNFQVGHDIPESKGGTIDIDNLKPICTSCNLSMSNKFTITEWSKLIDMNYIKGGKNKINNNNCDNKSDNKSGDTLCRDDTLCNKSCDDKCNNSNKPTFITKIKNSLPKIPSLSLISLVLNSFRYLKM